MIRYYISFILICCYCNTLVAQQQPLKVWLNENFSREYAFLRNETPWIDYVRNRGDADVQVQLTREGLAASQRQVLYFFGANRFEGQHDTIFFDRRPTEPFNSYRERLLRAYKRGLLSYLVQLPEAANLTFEPVEKLIFVEETYRDWGKWVCVAGGEASIRNNQSKYNSDFNLKSNDYIVSPDFSVWRVTRNHRIWLNMNYYNSNSNNYYFLSGREDTISVKNKQYGINAGYARALSRHWSAGASVNSSYAYSHDYRTGGVFGGPINRETNQEGIDYSAAIEYSILPYESFFRHRLLLSYQATISDNKYEKYGFGGPFSHRLHVNGAKLTTWGAFSGEAALIHQPRSVWDLYTFNVNGSLLINLKRNLYFNASFSGSWSNQADFSFLAPGIPFPESKNARTVTLRTGFGLIYSFGAEHLNIVNPRIGGL